MLDLGSLAQQLFSVKLNQAQLCAFEEYSHQLLDWNTRLNLTAIRTVDDVQVKHFLDSLSCLTVMRNGGAERVIDVGTGAGFPGLPIKIASPGMRITLVESVAKKAEFCRHIINQLKLEGVNVIIDRAESLGLLSQHRQGYDWAIGRAVAPLPVLCEYLLPLVRVGGAMLAMKGESAHQEIHNADKAIHILGGQLRKISAYTLPGVVEERYLVVINKVAATPPGYPRRVGLPAKRPIS